MLDVFYHSSAHIIATMQPLNADSLRGHVWLSDMHNEWDDTQELYTSQI